MDNKKTLINTRKKKAKILIIKLKTFNNSKNEYSKYNKAYKQQKDL